jgi:small-conductance mechanosensitive channel
VQDILQRVYFNNTVETYLIFVVSLLVSFAILKIAIHFLLKHLTKWATHSETTSSDVLTRSVKRYLLPILYFAAFYLNTKLLTLGEFPTKLINIAMVAFVTIMMSVFLSTFIIFIFNKYWEKNTTESTNNLAVKWAGGLIKAIVWGLAIVLFLDNIGVKINTLIAGLGIGGLAIAFAAQSILADLFCFVTIIFDRPFEIGDFIISGDQKGTVEHIGIKTTRLRSLEGEQLILSNADLTSSRIQNYKTLEQRRVLFHLGVTYDTPLAKMKEIPGMIQRIIESMSDTIFGRAHFYTYSSYSLDFEIVYFVLDNDYNRYMDIHQEINLKIKEQFEEQGIAFAFPTQTMQLQSVDLLK